MQRFIRPRNTMEDIEEIAVVTASVFNVGCKSRYVNLTYGFCMSGGFCNSVAEVSHPVFFPRSDVIKANVGISSCLWYYLFRLLKREWVWRGF